MNFELFSLRHMCVQVLVHSICIIYSYRLTHLLFSFAVQVTAPSSILLSLFPSLLIFSSQTHTHTPFASAAQCSEHTKKKSIIARFPFSPPSEQSTSRGSSSTNSQVYRFYWRSSLVAAAAAAAPFSIVVVADQIPTCVWPLQRAQAQCECCGGHTCMMWCKYVCMYLYVSPSLPWWDGVGIVPQLASTFFLPCLIAFYARRCCCAGAAVVCLCLCVRLLVSVLTAAKTTISPPLTLNTHTHAYMWIDAYVCLLVGVRESSVRWGEARCMPRAALPLPPPQPSPLLLSLQSVTVAVL